MDYRPIDCSLHDQYLAWATLKSPVAVLYTGEDGEERTSTGLIIDVFTSAEDRAEWMVLDNGERIRLDRIRQTSVL